MRIWCGTLLVGMSLLAAGPRFLDAGPAEPSAKGGFAAARRAHWAFQPITDPQPPAVAHTGRVRTPIDRFILAKLEENGMSFAPAADRRTLARRATFDLLGLPPGYDEVQRFVHDERPDAWARLVDRLLASPHYGERWGRYWLDIARYADTKGYVFAQETRYPFAYTYRDYVIRAFNEDLTYDRFLVEQLAADQLPDADSRSQAALGFLTVGRRFRNNTHDIIDDRIDVVTRGLMGLTVRCARCHDHKYDPVPTEDYYSLYGVFASSYEPEEKPLVSEPEKTDEYLAYKKELDTRKAALDEFVATKHREMLDELRTNVSDYLVKVVDNAGNVDRDFALSFGAGEPRPQVVRRWRKYLQQKTGTNHPVFGPWHELAKLPEESFAEDAAAVIKNYREDKAGSRVNRLVIEALSKAKPQSMFDVAGAYGELFADIYGQWKTVRQQAQDGAAPDGLPEPAAEELRQVLYGEDSPTDLTREEVRRIFDRAARNKLRKLQKKIDQWKVNSPHAPPRAMVMYDKEQPVKPRVFVRGSPGRRGDAVPRRFLRILAGAESKVFEKGSGRLELAREIANPENPLTARVLVNRVWRHHFGQGLVTTPSDFGARSDPPSHPKLLDYLASRFIEDGWSLKRLHRRIMLSAAYRQSSRDNPEYRRQDPQNRLVWRMNRRRLGFEAMRDSLLAASGQLSRTMGGRPDKLQKRPFPRRRTVYGFVDRNNLPGLFRTFDFANPDTSTAKRPQTTVPQQALFGMNGDFVIEQARALAAHPKVASQPDPKEKIEALYQRVLSRDPEPQELAWGLQYVQSQQSDDKADMSAWEQYAQALLLTNEFWFVD